MGIGDGYAAVLGRGAIGPGQQVCAGTGRYILAVQVPTNTRGVDGQKWLRRELQRTWQGLPTLTTT